MKEKEKKKKKKKKKRTRKKIKKTCWPSLARAGLLPRPTASPRAPPAAHAPSPSPARGSAQVLVPPRKRGGARSGLNSCLRPPFRTPLLLSPCAPLDPAAGPASGLDRPPESPLGLIWVASVSYYGPSSGGRAFFLKTSLFQLFWQKVAARNNIKQNHHQYNIYAQVANSKQNHHHAQVV